MSTDALVGVAFLLVILAALGACHLHDQVQKKRNAHRDWQRLEGAAIQADIARRTRKQNTMLAMRRTAKRRSTGGGTDMFHAVSDGAQAGSGLSAVILIGFVIWALSRLDSTSERTKKAQRKREIETIVRNRTSDADLFREVLDDLAKEERTRRHR
ncbi:hypothetical protein ID875_06960 [Streptomyces globisporus]|uniref:Uncharacterized protein n=1 Tax=Streptomyces globisporus TaxID=1908 RepID=A0A927BI95_STRGL|nr:hypothetical protein [Streptomyces globisporus]